jgi:hypothetical protein
MSTNQLNQKQRALQKPIIIHDERFAKLHFDPRFQKLPKTRRKLKIDRRFKRMFTDHKFSDSGMDSVHCFWRKDLLTFFLDLVERDKYGRRAFHTKSGVSDNLKRFYAIHDDDNDEETLAPPTTTTTTTTTTNTNNSESTKRFDFPSDTIQEKNVSKEIRLDSNENSLLENKSKQRLEEEESVSSTTTTTTTTSSSISSSEESELDSDDVEDSDFSDEEEEDNVSDLLPKEEIPLGTETTAQLAVLGCDWDHVKAVDLYMVFQSFLPPLGAVRSVAIYPSDFGLKMMAQERVTGPDVWETSDGSNSGGAADTLSLRKLRAHEIGRLRYFFALVRCDSPQTAAALYTQLDGYEFEHSSNRLDLRFVDDATAQLFTDQRVVSLTLETDLHALQTQIPRPCVSVCTPETVPTHYRPAAWVTRALQHTNVTLTWDQTDPQRTRILQRNLSAALLMNNNEEPVRESDYQAYLASSCSSDSSSSSSSASDDDDSHSENEGPSPEAILERIRQKREKRKAKRAQIRARYAPLLRGLLNPPSSHASEASTSITTATTTSSSTNASVSNIVDDNVEGDMEITFTTGLSQRAEQLIESKKKERLKVTYHVLSLPIVLFVVFSVFNVFSVFSVFSVCVQCV